MDPATILAAIGVGEQVYTWLDGVIQRHKAGQDPTADEVARLQQLQQLNVAAKAKDDAADAGLDQAIADAGK